MIDGSAPRYPLDGARVAVLGASGGPGGEIARALTSRGARLLLAGRDSGRLKRVGIPEAPIVEVDIRDPSCGTRSLRRRPKHPVDSMVSSTPRGWWRSDRSRSTTTTRSRTLPHERDGPLWLVRGVLPLLQASEGFVVQLSAVVAEQPLPGMAVYAATKAALTAADAALVRELRRVKVRVIDARPPHSETGLATRPIVGIAPVLPRGLAPAAVAERIVHAIEAGETAIPSTAF